MKAFLIVDLQIDFCPGGALPAPDGDKIVPVINTLMDKFDLVLASKDWHPVETAHFGKWPVHCVRETNGADLHPGLHVQNIDEIFLKGTRNMDDGYSAFEATNISLEDYLHRHQIDSLYIGGLATEYCVKATAVDAIKYGFQTYVIEDAIKGVEQNRGDSEMALRQMKDEGIQVINSSVLIK